MTSEQTRWIPCSEKMPDINIHVLAQFVMGGMAECYYAHNWWHIVGGVRISGDEVIAWMPLPQPYAESEGEDDSKRMDNLQYYEEDDEVYEIREVEDNYNEI